jgi:DNA polymerase-3 subunit alpha
MAHFAGYGFNKSHSTAYAVIAFRTAYLKAHYPVEYMAALMTNDMGNSDRMALHFAQCKGMGIQILPPDVNESNLDFTVVGGNVRFGLGAVKNVGHGAVEGVIEARRRGGPFASLQDFCERVDLRSLNARMIGCLIKAGACDSLGGHRAQLLAALDDIIEAASATQRERQAGQASLFEFAAEQEGQPQGMFSVEIPEIPPWSLRETLQHEKEQVGFYLSGHPLDEFEVDYHSFASSSIRRFLQNPAQSEVWLMGEIRRISRRLDRKGNMMAFFELEDFTGQVECIVFSKAHAAYGEQIRDDTVVLVRGSRNTRNGDVKCQVEEIVAADDYRREHARVLEIAWRALPATSDLKTLRAVLEEFDESHKGDPRLTSFNLKPDIPLRVRVVIPVNAHGHQLALEAGKALRVMAAPTLLTHLRQIPGIKRLTFRER